MLNLPGPRYLGGALPPGAVYMASLHDTATEIVCFRGNMHGGPEPFDGGEASKENTAPVSRQSSKPGPPPQQQQGAVVASPPKIAHLSGALSRTAAVSCQSHTCD